MDIGVCCAANVNAWVLVFCILKQWMLLLWGSSLAENSGIMGVKYRRTKCSFNQSKLHIQMIVPINMLLKGNKPGNCETNLQQPPTKLTTINSMQTDLTEVENAQVHSKTLIHFQAKQKVHASQRKTFFYFTDQLKAEVVSI